MPQMCKDAAQNCSTAGDVSRHFRRWLRTYWPPVAAMLCLWSAVAAELFSSWRWNQRHLIYALDDSYILMAMAKNLARHGVWGMTPFQFTASSSAPLWTALVAVLYWLTGVHTATPLVLNLLFATVLLFAVQWVLVSLAPGVSRIYVFVVLLVILFFSPILNLIFIGLEHSLHILLTLLFVYWAAEILSCKAPPTRRSEIALVALGVGLGSIRYEGLFAVALVSALLLFQRRIKLAVAVAGCSLIPPFIMGAISVSQGWFWLPNSVVLKGNLPVGEPHPVTMFLAHAIGNTFYSGMRVVRLLGAALLLLLWRYMERHEPGGSAPAAETTSQHARSVQMWMLAMFVAIATLHLLLASTGWFLRYEAYLVALGLTVIAAPLWDFVHRLRSSPRFYVGNVAGLAAVAVLLFSARLFCSAGYNGAWMTLPGTHDTYRWHYQMATFVQRYYPGASLVVNDIGAVDFLADIHLTDPHGLADKQIARARLSERGQLDPQALDRIARQRGAQVAMVDYNWVEFYGGSFRQVVPQSWLLAGVWKFHNRVVLAQSALGFYALNEAARAQLVKNLRQFSPHLPSDVEQSGPYTQNTVQ